jgi:cob(I)alamin adenosyltransferase
MATEKSKIYTRRGDGGTTSLGDGSRMDKCELRIEVIGCIDELNSLIGLIVAHGVSSDAEEILLQIQRLLFDLGSDLALIKPEKIQQVMVTQLEEALDQVDAGLPPLRAFILPGGSVAAANLHYARAVCRRTERRLCQLAEQDGGESSKIHLQFINRLSDLLFVLARAQNWDAGVTESCLDGTATGDNDFD